MDIAYNKEHQRLWKTYHMEIPYSGLAKLGQEWKQSNGCSPFSRLYYIIQGEGYLMLDDTCLSLKAGKVYLIPAGLVYGYGCQEYMEQLFFHVNYTYINGIDLFRECRQVYDREVSPQEMEQLKLLYLSDKLADAFLLKAKLLDELANFMSMAHLKEARTKNFSPLVEQMFYLAQNPVNANNRVSDLAEHLHVSPSTLTKRFHQETGMTPGEYMDQLIISKACNLLLTEEYSIARIAEELGFSDQFYFAKYFRKQMLVSPSGYRKQMRGDITKS